MNLQTPVSHHEPSQLIYLISTQPCATVLPAKSDSDVMFCLQSYQGLIIERSLVY